MGETNPDDLDFNPDSGLEKKSALGSAILTAIRLHENNPNKAIQPLLTELREMYGQLTGPDFSELEITKFETRVREIEKSLGESVE